MANVMRRKEEDRDKQIDKMITNVELLVKHMMGTEKSVNNIRSHGASLIEEDSSYSLFDEDIKYMVNQWFGSRLGYHGTTQGH
ncbi:hypothetical protein RDI58_017611 [Solanum bulbocastanum]|uniref:Uncharacterized protein n=1 Tax=Solanum bulbocastanum TaxID=147425 RepID=A0AAN8TFC6_SOLBU